MKRSVLALAAVLAVVVGCGSTKTVTRTLTVTTSNVGLGPPSELLQFGYIHSLKPKGSGWVMRFDPAFLLSGVTANTAAAEDKVVAPGEPVPNDNYRLNETHRLLTFLVPASAQIRVLTVEKNSPAGTLISVDELARIVNGGKHRKLFEPLATGVWIRYHVDTVQALDQQYQP